MVIFAIYGHTLQMLGCRTSLRQVGSAIHAQTLPMPLHDMVNLMAEAKPLVSYATFLALDGEILTHHAQGCVPLPVSLPLAFPSSKFPTKHVDFIHFVNDAIRQAPIPEVLQRYMLSILQIRKVLRSKVRDLLTKSSFPGLLMGNT